MKSLKLVLIIVFTASCTNLFAQKGKPYAKLIPYYQNGKWGYCNQSKVVVIPCIFDSVTAYDCSELEDRKIYSDDKGYGFLKGVKYEVYETGKVVNYNNPALVYKISKDKKLISVKPAVKTMEDMDLPPEAQVLISSMPAEIEGPEGKKFKFISSIGRKAILNSDGFYGLAEIEDEKYFERWILEPVFTKLDHIEYSDYYMAEKENEVRVYNLDTLILKSSSISYTMINAEQFPLDYAFMLLFAKDGNGFSFYNNKGEKLPWGSFEAFAPSNYNKMHIGVKRNGKWGVISKTGKLIIPFKYDSIDVSSSFCNLIKVRKGSKQGYIDLNGKEYF